MTLEMKNSNDAAEDISNGQYDAEISDLKNNVENNQNTVETEDSVAVQEDIEEKKEKIFGLTGVRLTWAEKKLGDKWVECWTTAIEFWWKFGNVDYFWYAQKDWYDWFKEWWEFFLTENLNLKNWFQLNGQQFYWWKNGAEMLFWPQKTRNKQIWNAEIWGKIGAYWTYDAIPSEKDKISWTWTIGINFSVKQKKKDTPIQKKKKLIFQLQRLWQALILPLISNVQNHCRLWPRPWN